MTDLQTADTYKGYILEEARPGSLQVSFMKVISFLFRYTVSLVLLVFLSGQTIPTARTPRRSQTPKVSSPRAVSFPAMAGASRGAWSIMGPGGGGAFYMPAISPHDSNVLFTSTDMTSCYSSSDGGQTWRAFYLRWRCTSFAFDAKDPKVIYTMARSLFRSLDGGVSWQLIYPANASSITFSDDEAETNYTYSGKYQEPPRVVAADPELADVVYCAIGTQILVSRDKGNSWNVLYSLKGSALSLFVNPHSPSNQRSIVVGSGTQTLFCADGVCKNSTPPNAPWIYSTSAGAVPDTKEFWVYTLTDGRIKDGVLTGGLQVSKDWGETWQQANEGVARMVEPGTFPVTLYAAAYRKDARILYLSYTRFQPRSSQDTFLGMLRSDDGGESWSTWWRENNSSVAQNIADPWVTPLFGPEWGENPLEIAVDPNDPDHLMTTDLGRVMVSRDGSRSFAGVYSSPTDDRTAFRTNGLDVTTCYGVHVDPSNSDRLLATYTDIGLWRSEDSGRSWKLSNQGIPREWRNTAYWMEFDPQVAGKGWAVFSSVHDLPRYKMRPRVAAATAKGGVAITDDGGVTWRPIRGSIPDSPTTHVLVDRTSLESESRTVYVTSFKGGVYKSTDSGETWAAANNGLPATKRAWRMSQANDGALYLVMTRMEESDSLTSDLLGSLWVSRDKAATWQNVPLPTGITFPHGLTPDPEDPSRLYLAAWPRYKRYDYRKATEGGVFLTTDQGQTWQHLFKGDSYIYDVTFDPTNPQIMYAGGPTGSMWRSSDRGNTWSRLKGFGFKSPHRAIVDPRDPSMVFITTYGNSIWWGPAAGDPSGADDVTGPATIIPK